MWLNDALRRGRGRRGDLFTAYRTRKLVFTYQRGNDEVSGRPRQGGTTELVEDDLLDAFLLLHRAPTLQPGEFHMLCFTNSMPQS